MKFIVDELLFIKSLLSASTNRGYTYQELKVLRDLSKRVHDFCTFLPKPEECPVPREERERPECKEKLAAWIVKVQAYLNTEVEFPLSDDEKQYLIARFINVNGFASEDKSMDLIFKVAEKLGV